MPKMQKDLADKLEEILTSSRTSGDQITALHSALNAHIADDREQFENLNKNITTLQADHASQAKWAGRIWGLATGIIGAVGTWMAEKLSR